jgi:hypothetical protein
LVDVDETAAEKGIKTAHEINFEINFKKPKNTLHLQTQTGTVP